MIDDDRVRDDIAFIRRAIEQGRGYAGSHSVDLLVWGIALAVGYVGTYATVSGWWRINSIWLWAGCIGLPWLYSLRPLLARLFRSDPQATRPPMAEALQMLWFGCGIFLSTLSIVGIVAGCQSGGGWCARGRRGQGR